MLLELLLPQRCVVCRRPGAQACAGCLAALPRLTDPQLTAMSADLLTRVEALEYQMARREQVFRKLTQMLGVS